MQPQSDEFIVGRVCAGDTNAYADLFERYKDGIYGYSLRLLRNTSKAEDALQTTFAKALEAIASLEDPRGFKYWLFIIARNEVYGMLKASKNRGPVRSLEMSDDPWDPDTPFTLAVHADMTDLIQEHLGQLKEEYREVLILREYEQLSYAEIAAITGVTESSVKNRLFKARKALSNKLRPFFG